MGTDLHGNTVTFAAVNLLWIGYPGPNVVSPLPALANHKPIQLEWRLCPTRAKALGRVPPGCFLGIRQEPGKQLGFLLLKFCSRSYALRGNGWGRSASRGAERRFGT